MAYMADGQSAIAMQKLKKALEVDDKSADAHNVIGILYQQLGEIDRAGKHYDRAVELDARDPYIRNARRKFLLWSWALFRCAARLRKALANPLYPTPWVALTNAGLCVEREGDDVKAENYYRRALTASANYPTALIKMAEVSLPPGEEPLRTCLSGALP